VLEEWLAWLTIERGLSQGTVKAYHREVRNLAIVYGPRFAMIGTEDLRERLYAAGGNPGTVARRISAWASFYGWLVRTDRRLDDPTHKIDRPRIKRGLPKPVPDPDGVFAELEPHVRSIAVFLRETGLRLSEALSVDVAVPAPDQLLVHGKGDKERIVPLTEKARAALDDLGGRVSLKGRTIQRKFQKVGIHPHALRHTLACELIASGADLGEVQDILGHASPATTRIYAAYRVDRLRTAMERRAG